LSLGIHPHDSKSIVDEPSSWLDFEMVATQPECVAIGPCGLDFQRDFAEPEVQKEVFEKHIKLACSLEKPLLIHERSAQTEVLEIIKK
jgi:TatD DNase family protein